MTTTLRSTLTSNFTDGEKPIGTEFAQWITTMATVHNEPGISNDFQGAQVFTGPVTANNSVVLNGETTFNNSVNFNIPSVSLSSLSVSTGATIPTINTDTGNFNFIDTNFLTVEQTLSATNITGPDDLVTMANVNAANVNATKVTSTFSGDITGNVKGNVTGNVLSSNGVTILNSGSTGSNTTFTGGLSGSMIGSISANSGTSTAPGIAFVQDPDTGIYRSGENSLALSTGGSSRLLIDSSGKIGVNTDTPSHRLTVIGDISSTGAIRNDEIYPGLIISLPTTISPISLPIDTLFYNPKTYNLKVTEIKIIKTSGSGFTINWSNDGTVWNQVIPTTGTISYYTPPNIILNAMTNSTSQTPTQITINTPSGTSLYGFTLIARTIRI